MNPEDYTTQDNAADNRYAMKVWVVIDTDTRKEMTERMTGPEAAAWLANKSAAGHPGWMSIVDKGDNHPTPAHIAKMDQANAELDGGINITLAELKAQFAEGYSEEMITMGMYDYLVNHSDLTHKQLTVAYMRAMIRLAQADENIYPKRTECPDCGGTNNAKMCVNGKCLIYEVHEDCDSECVAAKSGE